MQNATQYATVRRRAVAVILDLVIIAAIASPIWMAGSIFTTNTIPTEGGGTMVIPTGFVASPWTGLLLGVLPLVYFAVLEGLFGATPGKMLLGLRVVRLDGAPIGWREAVIRNLLRYVDSLFAYLVGAIAAWSSPLRQRLGDRAARTVVLYLPAAQVVRPAAPTVYAPAGQMTPGTMPAVEERPLGASAERR